MNLFDVRMHREKIVAIFINFSFIGNLDGSVEFTRRVKMTNTIKNPKQGKKVAGIDLIDWASFGALIRSSFNLYD
jgi:hypothetical protein